MINKTCSKDIKSLLKQCMIYEDCDKCPYQESHDEVGFSTCQDALCDDVVKHIEELKTMCETAYVDGWNDCKKAYKETFEHIRKAAEAQLSTIEKNV